MKLTEIKLDRNKPMVCAECRENGPRPKDPDWKGWTQCGVEFVQPKHWIVACWCPDHGKKRELNWSEKTSWPLHVLQEFWKRSQRKDLEAQIGKVE